MRKNYECSFYEVLSLWPLVLLCAISFLCCIQQLQSVLSVAGGSAVSGCMYRGRHVRVEGTEGSRHAGGLWARCCQGKTLFVVAFCNNCNFVVVSLDKMFVGLVLTWEGAVCLHSYAPILNFKCKSTFILSGIASIQRKLGQHTSRDYVRCASFSWGFWRLVSLVFALLRW